MARNGPGDDFYNQPTQHGGFGVGGQPPGEYPPAAPDEMPPDRFEQPPPDYLDEEAEPTPWYRRPAMLIAWLLFVLILIALIVYGIVELIGGNQGTTNAPRTSTPSSTTTPTTTTSTTPTTTTTPPSSSTVEQPAQQPPQQQPNTQQPTHHHHLPTLPPVISIPGVPTVITVPPGLR